MYDIFFIGKSVEQWQKVKKIYPNAQHFPNLKIKDLQKKSFTKMFWVINDDFELSTNFNLNEYRATKWDDEYVHVFRNGEFYDGICLIPKNNEISNREFENRFFICKKEIDIEASKPVPFEIFYLNTYDDYLKALDQSKLDMFWSVWNDTELLESFKFDYYVPVYDTFHRSITHVFKNGKYYDGICLFSKKNKISKKEFDHRFYTNKKEVDVVASQPELFDIVFISYYEPNADKHYNHLINIVKRPVHRINGVKGIHNAHIEAAKLVKTNMFWVVDADAEVLDNFDFDRQILRVDQDIVFVWKSKNPVNGLEYGNGGIKLLPTKLTLEMKTDSPDMTTSISGRFRAMPEISNITKFNTDPFNSWKSAFRECCKLASRIIPGQSDNETQYRLDVWCNETTDPHALHGAIQGRDYGHQNRNSIDMLNKINDFDWLRDVYEKQNKKNY